MANPIPSDLSPPPAPPSRAPAATRVGHVHLKVSDLDRAVAFYRDVIGLDLVQRYGRGAAFLSAGSYPHHLGLNTWESLGGAAPARRPVVALEEGHRPPLPPPRQRRPAPPRPALNVLADLLGRPREARPMGDQRGREVRRPQRARVAEEPAP